MGADAAVVSGRRSGPARRGLAYLPCTACHRSGRPFNRRAAAGVRLPERDLTEVPFVTIDPEGSMDLDQALHIGRDGGGYLVRYAIADVAAFVTPGGPIDVECHQRVETLYAPTRRTPLHPQQACRR